MTRPKLLFLIDSLQIGGAEKSLLTLLHRLDPDAYDVSLLVLTAGGAWEAEVPAYVKRVAAPAYFRWLQGEKGRGIFPLLRMLVSLRLRLTRLHPEQAVFSTIRRVLDLPQERYDTVIAYSQGMPTYVASHLQADRKTAWINMDYAAGTFDRKMDAAFYEQFDQVTAVSPYIQASLEQHCPEMSGKTVCFPDIVDPSLVQRLAEAPAEDLHGVRRIVTVGRLDPAKGIDRIPAAAAELKQAGVDFRWYVIGEGPARAEVEQAVKAYQVEEEVQLLGARANPYPLMKQAGLYVQPSRKEGFGMAVLEAAALRLPIICTPFGTAPDLCRQTGGWLVKAEALGAACAHMLEHPQPSSPVPVPEHALHQLLLGGDRNETDAFYAAESRDRRDRAGPVVAPVGNGPEPR
ncbi:glycosyltransferase [Alkalicoccus chagannorensis]|uniref:glycosyltransferase n=1 Tax=Alkalicoccus chagannorensis TaxID=427072 RepID=UPI00040207EA|nr:glycosyltransferase [Alkalicoccus chagannorensis]